MPTPIIDLQRRLSLVGAIRCGERSDRGAPKRLDTFRITSPSRGLIEQAAELYGGTVSEWTSPSGTEWQVTTLSSELTVLVMPSYSLRQTYELWEGASKRTRVCDGLEMTDGSPCACAAEGVDKCDLYTRLVVALPELDTVLGWRLITKGVNAGHEIPTIMSLINSVAEAKPFVPAKLRLVERHGVKDGQKVRYVVPTLDLGAGYTAIAASAAQPRQVEAAYTPVPAKQLEQTVTVQAALELADAKPKTRGARAAAPMADIDDDFDGAPIPAAAEAVEQDKQEKVISDAQRRRLFAIAKEHQVDEQALKTLVQFYASVDSTKNIPASAYEQVVEAIRSVKADVQ